MRRFKISEKALHAIYLGSLCSVSYLAVYIARNILGAVNPQMLASGEFSEELIGQISSAYFISYAVGQLINGVIGDKIKARYMISIGLLFAGISNLLFATLSSMPIAAIAIYAFTGFSLAMIYGPMAKVVAENTEPIYATRCSIGYTFASFIGSPMAGIFAAIFTWKNAFAATSLALIAMSILSFAFFLVFEKRGLVKYGQYKCDKKSGGSIKVLLKHHIIKFSFISIITGVVRTSVIFWLSTYFVQRLGYTTQTAAGIFTVTTFIISFTTFIAIFVYERLKRNLDLTILIMFSLSTVFFALVYFVEDPVANIILIVLAIMASNSSATMLWSCYCPSLYETGMVSSATGFLDFLSYIAAAVANLLFANAVTAIGWSNLILVWIAITGLGVIVALPYGKILKKKNQ